VEASEGRVHNRFPITRSTLAADGVP
jgi:hypothetical protein